MAPPRTNWRMPRSEEHTSQLQSLRHLEWRPFHLSHVTLHDALPIYRIILAFYLGVGFALVIAMVKNGAPPNQLADAPAADPWSQVNEPLLAATITMLGLAMIGTRVAFSIPLDLRGNWIFRVTRSEEHTS